MGKRENVIYLGSHTMQHAPDTAGITAFRGRALNLWSEHQAQHLAFVPE